MAQDAFRLAPEDEFPHPAEPAPNFNESGYVNAFDSASGAGGWMRIGNRVNEGYAERPRQDASRRRRTKAA
jgi:hypothetical protein